MAVKCEEISINSYGSILIKDYFTSKEVEYIIKKDKNVLVELTNKEQFIPLKKVDERNKIYKDTIQFFKYKSFISPFMKYYDFVIDTYKNVKSLISQAKKQKRDKVCFKGKTKGLKSYAKIEDIEYIFLCLNFSNDDFMSILISGDYLYNENIYQQSIKKGLIIIEQLGKDSNKTLYKNSGVAASTFEYKDYIYDRKKSEKQLKEIERLAKLKAKSQEEQEYQEVCDNE